VTATSAAGLSLAVSNRVALVALAMAQTLGVSWLFVEGWTSARQWASATCVLAAAWTPLFLIASWIYAFDPGLLADVARSPEPALAIMNLALFALIAAWLGFGGRRAMKQVRAPVIAVQSHRLDRRWVVVWVVTGLLGLAAFLVLTGGPVAYLSDIDEAGSRAAGLTYVIWLALALKFCALTVLAHHWASEEGRRRNVLLLVLGAAVLLSLFGQRAFIALMLVQVALLYALIRRPLQVRLVAPLALVLLAAITFGIGTVKRYQNYTSVPSAEKLSFVDYVQTRAAKEVIQAYVGNYADGVRLVARARAVVPQEAGYEKGRGFVRLALQPIPSFVRPNVQVAAPLRPLLESNRGYTHALPIPLVGYVEFGLFGVVLAGGLLGLAVVAVDRQLARDHLSLIRLLLLVAAAVQIPFCLRTGIPRGVAFATLDLLGMWIVARTCLGGSARRAESARTIDQGVAGVSRA
jgi:hypothetical protein